MQKRKRKKERDGSEENPYFTCLIYKYNSLSPISEKLFKTGFAPTRQKHFMFHKQLQDYS